MTGVPAALGGTWSADGTVLFNSSLSRGSHNHADLGKEWRTGRGHLDERHRRTHLSALPSRRPSFRVFPRPLEQVGDLLGQLDGPQRTRLLDADYAEYGPSGYLFFVRDRALFAQQLDASRLEVTGSPLQIAENVAGFSTSLDGFDCLPSGSGRGLPDGLVRPVWQGDRTAIWPWGNTVDVPGWHSRRGGPRPWNHHARAGQDLWVLNRSRDVFTKLTVGPGARNSPVWSPDGRRIAFATIGANALYETAADGGGTEKLLLKARRPSSRWIGRQTAGFSSIG